MTKTELIKKIEYKESQLVRAEREMNCWNRGKYKHSVNAAHSKIYVDALKKELEGLRLQLTRLNSCSELCL